MREDVPWMLENRPRMKKSVKIDYVVVECGRRPHGVAPF
jgi:hypothetical protein